MTSYLGHETSVPRPGGRGAEVGYPETEDGSPRCTGTPVYPPRVHPRCTLRAGYQCRTSRAAVCNGPSRHGRAHHCLRPMAFG